MPEQRISTEALIDRLDKLNSELISEAKERHQANNRLAGTFANAIDRISDTRNQFTELFNRLNKLEMQMLELDHLSRGVDGKNGMRGDVRDIKATQKWQTHLILIGVGILVTLQIIVPIILR
jgi:hypothetical protein